MNSQVINTQVSPKVVITVYADKAHNNQFLEERKVRMIKGKAELMAPMPVTEESIKRISDLYRKQEGEHMTLGLIEEHLLFASNKGTCSVMWWRPAGLKALNFKDKLIKITKGAQRTWPIPATLWLVHSGELFIWALADDSRPDGKTKLYNAPFFNIYEDARVCLGTAPIGRERSLTFSGEAARYERGFFLAEQNGGDQINRAKSQLPVLWTGLAGKRVFPSKRELLPHKKYPTVYDLIKKLIESGKYSL